jgi:hypothetical protein
LQLGGLVAYGRNKEKGRGIASPNKKKKGNNASKTSLSCLSEEHILAYGVTFPRLKEKPGKTQFCQKGIDGTGQLSNTSKSRKYIA